MQAGDLVSTLLTTLYGLFPPFLRRKTKFDLYLQTRAVPRSPLYKTSGTMSQNKWKVGSFLQQAVAGVESRLDQMLTEEEDAKRQQQMKQRAMRPKSGDQSGSTLLDDIVLNV